MAIAPVDSAIVVAEIEQKPVVAISSTVNRSPRHPVVEKLVVTAKAFKLNNARFRNETIITIKK
ncbi:MAG TPA: hypothetical protein VMH86_08530 [Rhizomicrobium sp.]|nr:hypothetical protein [Rhizomicrobium sp.]